MLYFCLMRLNEINENIEKIQIDSESKEALLRLIDKKIEEDMEKVINEIKIMESKFDSKISMIMWALGIIIALMVALKIFA